MAKRSVEVAPPKTTVVRKGPQRRTRVVVRKVGPLSVLRISLFFYFCLFLILFFSLMILFGFLQGSGALDSVGNVLAQLNIAGKCQEVGGDLKCVLEFNSGWIFSRFFFIGLGLVAVWSVINVLIAFLYNLVSDVIGGIELTLGEKR
jgi:hypothetical protein